MLYSDTIINYISKNTDCPGPTAKRCCKWRPPYARLPFTQKNLEFIHRQIKILLLVCVCTTFKTNSKTKNKRSVKKKADVKTRNQIGFMKTWNLKIEVNLNLTVILYETLLYIYICICTSKFSTFIVMKAKTNLLCLRIIIINYD